MARFRLSPKAQQDILEISDFIRRDNPLRALTFVRELRAKIAAAAQNPLHYRDRTELKQGVRAARHGQYLILFRFDGQIVEVLRVRHGATEMGELFEEG